MDYSFAKRPSGCIEFSPVQVTLISGQQYTMREPRYQNNVFERWQDTGSTSPDRKTVEIDSIKQLEHEDRPMKASEVLRYVITDSKANNGRRSTPVELVDASTEYDENRYVELLAKVYDSVLSPLALR